MSATIAMVFDFDDTLAADSTSGYLLDAGIGELGAFWNQEVAALIAEDWDPVPAYLYQMIAAAKAGRLPPITRQSLQAWGRKVQLYEGVATLFPRLRTMVHDANPQVAIEFYLISSGLGDILRATSIAHEFTDIWASEFHYAADGGADFPKKLVSFTDKTRYLFQIQKGIVGPQGRGKPFEVNQKLAPEQVRIPLKQMIFVGDGYTDIPCFALVKQNGGLAVAVFDQTHRERWGRACRFVQDGRVDDLWATDYSANSDLSRFLGKAVTQLATNLAEGDSPRRNLPL